MKPRKAQCMTRNRQKEADLRMLPPNVMRTIVEKMSVEEHMAFRAVCKYAHDEVESFWRSQRSISIAKLQTWFPYLRDEPWKLGSLSCILNELSIVFNLFRPGNVRKLSLRGVLGVNIKSLVRCAEMATGNVASTFFENLGEFDMRGCFIAPDQMKLLDELFPNLHTILLHPNAILNPKQKNRKLLKLKTEVTHHHNISSAASKIRIQHVPSVDMQTVAFVREHIPDVRHVFIDLDY